MKNAQEIQNGLKWLDLLSGENGASKLMFFIYVTFSYEPLTYICILISHAQNANGLLWLKNPILLKRSREYIRLMKVTL